MIFGRAEAGRASGKMISSERRGAADGVFIGEKEFYGRNFGWAGGLVPRPGDGGTGLNW